MAVTLKKVAKEAGLAVSTVSSILNGKHREFNINPATAERVLEVARRLNYSPSGRARDLARGRNGCIGIFSSLMSELQQHELFHQMIIRIGNLSNAKDINTMVFADSGSVPLIPRMIRERYVDGVIVIHSAPDYVFEKFSSLDMPYVVVNGQAPQGKGAINPDDGHGMKLAVEHLSGLGHKRILYLNRYSSRNHPSMGIRLRAYFDTMKCCGIDPYPGSDTKLGTRLEDKVSIDGLRDPEEFLYEQLMKPANVRPTAVIVYHGLWLRKVMLAIEKASLRVPEDVSVLSFDGLSIMRQWIPSITHVCEPLSEMSELAVNKLFAKIENRNGSEESIVLPEELVVMESTAKPPVH